MKVYFMTKEGDSAIGTKEMEKDVSEVIEKGDLLESGKEGEGGRENTLEEIVVDSEDGGHDAKRSHGKEKKMEGEEDGSKEAEKEAEEEETKQVEADRETSEMKSVDETAQEKNSSAAAAGGFELSARRRSTDEKPRESENGMEVKSGRAENTLDEREGESGEIGPEDDTVLGKEESCEKNAENLRSEVSSAAEADGEKCGDQIKSGDGCLEQLQKLEPIWMKR